MTITSRPEPEMSNPKKPLTVEDLNEQESAIYNDAYLNVPVKYMLRANGFKPDQAGVIAFHQKFQHVLDLAHAAHQRDLRMAQWDLAVNKQHPTMLVWLGKQAGQSDIQAVELGEVAENTVDPTVIVISRPKRER